MLIFTSHCETYACCCFHCFFIFAVQILSSGSHLSTHGFHFFPKLETLCPWSYFLLGKKDLLKHVKMVKSSLKCSSSLQDIFSSQKSRSCLGVDVNKGTFQAKMGSIEDGNGMDLAEAEDIKKRWQEYTEELYKKDLHKPDNHNGVITHLEPDIL